jgi:hypothetical protein
VKYDVEESDSIIPKKDKSDAYLGDLMNEKSAPSDKQNV